MRTSDNKMQFEDNSMLTPTTIKNLKPKGYPYRKADGAVQGLGVHVSKLGHKSFVLSRKVDGKRTFHKIDDVCNISLKQARELAFELRKQPLNEYKEEEVYGTVKELIDGYLLHLSQKGSKSVKAARIILYKDGIDTIKDRIANTITSEEIADIIRIVVRRGALTQATHTRAYLHAAWAWGMSADLDVLQESNGSNFKLTRNVVSPIPKPQKGTTALDRWLSEDEIKKVWNAMADSPLIGAALKLQLCTGQRVREVLSLKWDDIEIVNNIALWYLPTTKNGKPHSVVLNNTALQVLCDLYKHTGHAPICFPKRHTTTEMMTNNSLSQYTLKLTKRLKMERFAPRDLRRTWKTHAIKNGINKTICDRIQNHSLHDVSSRHYDRYSYLPEKTESMLQWDDILQDILE